MITADYSCGFSFLWLSNTDGSTRIYLQNKETQNGHFLVAYQFAEQERAHLCPSRSKRHSINAGKKENGKVDLNFKFLMPFFWELAPNRHEMTT